MLHIRKDAVLPGAVNGADFRVVSGIAILCGHESEAILLVLHRRAAGNLPVGANPGATSRPAAPRPATAATGPQYSRRYGATGAPVDGTRQAGRSLGAGRKGDAGRCEVSRCAPDGGHHSR